MRFALHGARRGDRGRRGTERQEAGDPATRDERQGKVSEGEQTGGRTGSGRRGREGGRGGALPRELLCTVLALAGGQRVGDGRAEKGATRCPTTERAARSARGTGQGGVPRRAATRQPAPKGAVCCVPA